MQLELSFYAIYSTRSLGGGEFGGTTGDNNILMFLRSVAKVSTRLESTSRPATSFHPDLIIPSQTKIALNKFNLLFS